MRATALTQARSLTRFNSCPSFPRFAPLHVISSRPRFFLSPVQVRGIVYTVLLISRGL